MNIGPFDGDPAGATPLTEEERAGLRATWVATCDDLDAAERDDIAAGLTSLARRRPSVVQVLDETFVHDLHRRMFGTVWARAGTSRTTERNIGIGPMQVAIAVRDLLADAMLWFAPDVTWTTPDLAACRLTTDSFRSIRSRTGTVATPERSSISCCAPPGTHRSHGAVLTSRTKARTEGSTSPPCARRTATVTTWVRC